ncbi:pyridoxal-phosphate dependent enzyme [Paludibaculum fermentans]|uniref:Pyridoxal-phosphate dependent enzyme n=1 Tax=Paludibaculum fermentans TaxID=1473598 RepID=A0A7S7NLY3_PALFE|nr:pyridoxal-phosphate dependent enzyme [Paludibaculum fermentans]QOY86023.1 pyridoxal-phosphate dependent enzyme [Paludibaculum fermentans]
MSAITIDDIRAASARIAPIAQKTPIWTSRSFDERAGAEVFFKCENLQKGGAFKIRGAANFLYSMTPEQRAKGVVGFSSGNHAQAVAIAARILGVQATLIMPDDAPKSKLAATRANGATVITYDRLKESREAIGRRISEETGAMLVPPFDHPWIVAGAGTCALEIMEQVPSLDALVVCLGGGGLLSGSAVAAKAINPSIRVFGVEPELGNDYWLSRREGKPVEISSPLTIADGLRTTKPGALNFPIIQELVEDVLLVTEDEIKETTKFVMTRMKLVVEPSGVVGASAVLHKKLPPGLNRVAVILSGGNVDLEVLATL